MERKEINYYFEMLNESLKTTALPTSTGENRLGVFSGEFMLMRETGDNKISFKHIGQRNYLYMDKITGEISIPLGGSFFLGEFDSYNIK